jgi:hypothetical protein
MNTTTILIVAAVIIYIAWHLPLIILNLVLSGAQGRIVVILHPVKYVSIPNEIASQGKAEFHWNKKSANFRFTPHAFQSEHNVGINDHQHNNQAFHQAPGWNQHLN